MLVRSAAIYSCPVKVVAVEAFAGNRGVTSLLDEYFATTVTNDIDAGKATDYHLDASEFLRDHLPARVDLVDLDPYGSPWEAYDALMAQAKKIAPFVLVLTDGLGYAAKRGGHPGAGSRLFSRHLKRLGIVDELTGRFPAYSTYAYEIAARAYVVESARQSYGVRADMLASSVSGGSHPMIYSAWRIS